MTNDVSVRLHRLRAAVDRQLRDLMPADRSNPLHDAVAYVLEGAGKRIRPVLLLTTAQAFGAELDEAMPAALAVEVFHDFTLVHDDIMDRAESRRGRATVHVQWDESIGILAGDYLLAMSFELLTRLDDTVMARAIARFHHMVVLLCEGQALDTEYETRTTVTPEEYLDMISRKTAALLEASLVLGGMVAAVPDRDLAHLETAGRHAGCAFQIQDDLLDLTARPESWGKPLGNDLMSGKKSYLTIEALQFEANSGGFWFSDRMAEGGIAQDEVAEARERLDAMGILEDARSQIGRHYQASLEALDRLNQKVDLNDTRWIIERLLTRNV